MSYYNATELIKATAESTGLITTVTHGDLNSADIKRATLYPLLHIVPQGMTFNGSTVDFQFTLYFMDIIDFSKGDQYTEAEPFRGVDNLIDVFNAMSIAAQVMMDKLNRTALSNVAISVPNGATFFSNRFENALSGVEMQLTITYPSTATTDGIC